MMNGHSDNELDTWLLGSDRPEPDEPLTIHKYQILMARYQKANNTRWQAARDLRVGRDLDDGALVQEARFLGRRARALMDDAVSGLLELWGSLPEEVQRDQWGNLPTEVKERLDTPAAADR